MAENVWIMCQTNLELHDYLTAYYEFSNVSLHLPDMITEKTSFISHLQR